MRGLIPHFSSSLSCSAENRGLWLYACFLFRCRSSSGGRGGRLNGIGRAKVNCGQLSRECKSSCESGVFSSRAFTFTALLRGRLREDSLQISLRFTAGNVPPTGFQIPRDLQTHQSVVSLSLSSRFPVLPSLLRMPG